MDAAFLNRIPHHCKRLTQSILVKDNAKNVKGNSKSSSGCGNAGSLYALSGRSGLPFSKPLSKHNRATSKFLLTKYSHNSDNSTNTNSQSVSEQEGEGEGGNDVSLFYPKSHVFSDIERLGLNSSRCWNVNDLSSGSNSFPSHSLSSSNISAILDSKASNNKSIDLSSAEHNSLESQLSSSLSQSQSYSQDQSVSNNVSLSLLNTHRAMTDGRRNNMEISPFRLFLEKLSVALQQKQQQSVHHSYNSHKSHRYGHGHVEKSHEMMKDSINTQLGYLSHPIIQTLQSHIKAIQQQDALPLNSNSSSNIMSDDDYDDENARFESIITTLFRDTLDTLLSQNALHLLPITTHILISASTHSLLPTTRNKTKALPKLADAILGSYFTLCVDGWDEMGVGQPLREVYQGDDSVFSPVPSILLLAQESLESFEDSDELTSMKIRGLLYSIYISLYRTILTEKTVIYLAMADLHTYFAYIPPHIPLSDIPTSALSYMLPSLAQHDGYLPYIITHLLHLRESVESLGVVAEAVADVLKMDRGERSGLMVPLWRAARDEEDVLAIVNMLGMPRRAGRDVSCGVVGGKKGEEEEEQEFGVLMETLRRVCLGDERKVGEYLTRLRR
jgi:hypothetical protein